MSERSKAQEKLLSVVRNAIKQDGQLRAELQVGDKFRFIRDSLTSLLTGLEAELVVLKEATEVAAVKVGEDDVNVYVYIFNSQGLDVASWRKMVSPEVYYEYSVSRPIYAEKEHIEKLIDSKPTRTQHGFITVSVKKDALLPVDEAAKDALGNQLIKVKEGALKIDRVVCFTHNSIDYTVGPKGEIAKKD